MLVRELMTSPATSLRVGSRLDASVRALATHGISAVPIVDGNEHVVGIVSEADILAEGVAPDPRAHLRPVAEPGEPWHRLVDDVMTRDPVTAGENSDVGWVGRVLADHGWKSLPVVREGRLVGIISRSDILRALNAPDLQIARRVIDEFTELGRDEWRVQVSEGVVTVRGPEPGREARIARAVVETVAGVRRVVVEVPAP